MNNEEFVGQVESITPIGKVGQKIVVSGKTFRLWATKWKDNRPHFDGLLPAFSIGDTVKLNFLPRPDSYQGRDFISNDVVDLSIITGEVQPSSTSTTGEAQPSPTPTTKTKAPDLWAKDLLSAKQTCLNGAITIAAAMVQAGLLKEKGEITAEVVARYQEHRQILFPEEPLETALTWAKNQGITPKALDEFIQGYKTKHNMTTLEVLTLINQGKIASNEIDDIPF